jgi:hypothetical protein
MNRLIDTSNNHLRNTNSVQFDFSTQSETQFHEGGAIMTHNRLSYLVLLGSMAFLLGFGLPALAKDMPKTTMAKQMKTESPSHTKSTKASQAIMVQAKPTKRPPLPAYQPPRRGAPGGRIGGATRGPVENLPVLYALAPDHLGLTIAKQPTLYWYMSKASDYPLELTIMDENGVNPETETILPSPTQGGVHHVALEDLSLSLEKGKAYQWFVSLVVDPDRRSNDVIAGGRIEFVDTPSQVIDSAPQTSAEDLTRLYAEAGLWYDAIRSISREIDLQPNNVALKHIRSTLLQQVGLDELSQLDENGATLGDPGNAISTTPASNQG